MLALHVAFSIVVVYLLFSLDEYVTHRYLMHRMKFARWLKSRFLKRLCANHMTLHHKRGYRHTDDEPDDSLADIMIAAAFVGLPTAPLVYYIDPITVHVAGAFAVVYSVVWWMVHLEMHRDRGWFFAKNPVFRYLERRHQQHHLYPDTQYNILLPFWDWVFRTHRVPAERLARRQRAVAL
jgi:hypothetical protein